MYIKEKEYSSDFVKQCKQEFGLEPNKVKYIVATLAENNCLDVDTLLKQVYEINPNFGKRGPQHTLSKVSAFV